MITIKCKVCGRDFEWTDGEQEFYKDRQLNEPKRCKDCRRKRIPEIDNVESVEGQAD